MTQYAPGDYTMNFESASESSCQQGMLLFGAAEGAGERRSVGAYVVVFVFACSQSQKVSKAAPWQNFLHLEEIALKTGACWLHSLCLT